MREERKLKLKLVVTARFQWRFESSPRHPLPCRGSPTGRGRPRAQSQTLAPDSAFAADRRIDRAQAPGRRNAGSSPARTARCAVVQRQDAATSRLTWVLKRAGVRIGRHHRVRGPATPSGPLHALHPVIALMPLHSAIAIMLCFGECLMTGFGDCVHKERGFPAPRHTPATCTPLLLREPELP